jgi:hypothetical protein
MINPGNLDLVKVARTVFVHASGHGSQVCWQPVEAVWVILVKFSVLSGRRETDIVKDVSLLSQLCIHHAYTDIILLII